MFLSKHYLFFVMSNLKQVIRSVKDSENQEYTILVILITGAVILGFRYLLNIFYQSESFRNDFNISNSVLVLTLIYAAVIILIVVLGFLVYYKYNKNQLYTCQSFIQFTNWWSVLTLILILLAPAVSLQAYYVYMGYELPLGGELIPNKEYSSLLISSISSTPSIECDNLGGIIKNRNYVAGDMVDCQVQISYKKGFDRYLAREEIQYMYTNDSPNSLLFQESLNFSFPGRQNLEMTYPLKIKISNDFVAAIATFYFKGEDGELLDTYQFYFIPIEVLAQKEYKQKKEKAFLFTAGVFTLFSVTIVSTIKNLKDISKKKD